jgi:hypothetical protein
LLKDAVAAIMHYCYDATHLYPQPNETADLVTVATIEHGAIVYDDIKYILTLEVNSTLY